IVIHNALNNTPPRAGFAFGNRYELGYRDQGNGWVVGVLDGPDLNQTQFYGFAPDAATNGGIHPFINRDYTDGSDVNAPPPNTNGTIAGGNERAFGFGSVPVMFETAPGFMKGFRDYMNNFSDALLGTQGGIYRYVGNYGASVDPSALPIPFLHLA